MAKVHYTRGASFIYTNNTHSCSGLSSVSLFSSGTLACDFGLFQIWKAFPESAHNHIYLGNKYGPRSVSNDHKRVSRIKPQLDNRIWGSNSVQDLLPSHLLILNTSPDFSYETTHHHPAVWLPAFSNQKRKKTHTQQPLQILSCCFSHNSKTEIKIEVSTIDLPVVEIFCYPAFLFPNQCPQRGLLLIYPPKPMLRKKNPGINKCYCNS